MFDLLTTLYADDTLRFALWHLLSGIGLDGVVAWVLDISGFIVWEDFSISPK